MYVAENKSCKRGWFSDSICGTSSDAKTACFEAKHLEAVKLALTKALAPEGYPADSPFREVMKVLFGRLQ